MTTADRQYPSAPRQATLTEPLKASRARVAKTMAAGAPGTLKLQKRFGPDLMIVRYRYDWTGLIRFTTVELVVARKPLEAAVRRDAQYAIRISKREWALRTQLEQRGARWDHELRCWILSAAMAQALDVADRVELIARQR